VTENAALQKLENYDSVSESVGKETVLCATRLRKQEHHNGGKNGTHTADVSPVIFEWVVPQCVTQRFVVNRERGPALPAVDRRQS
jgi:hypothetical protein